MSEQLEITGFTKTREECENIIYNAAAKSYDLEQILNKIEKIVNNKDITGIEAKLMIIDILKENKND